MITGWELFEVSHVIVMFAALHYLYGLMPRRPTAPRLFTSGQMLKDSANSMEDQEEIELDPLIRVQHDLKTPTRLEARTAHAQFLALCWSLFLLGWNDGSTGPLLPRIQKSYDVKLFSFY